MDKNIRPRVNKEVAKKIKILAAYHGYTFEEMVDKALREYDKAHGIEIEERNINRRKADLVRKKRD